MKITLLCALVVLLASAFAFAQRQTGAIEGSVISNEGEALPGVTIIASSASVIGGSVVTYTDEGGYYRFPYLPPGDYEVRAELTGFQARVQQDVRLLVTTTLTINFDLQLAEIAETIEIIDAPPLIDATPSVSQTVPTEIISSLPKRDKIDTLIALTPGVSDDLIAYGAGPGARFLPSENSFWVDGINVSDPIAGNLLLRYDQNWIDQVQVLGIGAPAEYGGFTGVLANFVTRSGGNQFHGLFETFFENENLVSTNVPSPYPEIPFKTYNFSSQLGGPIQRDRLWFFSGFEYAHTENRNPLLPAVGTEVQSKLLTKLTYKWNENHTLQGFVHYNDYRAERPGHAPVVLPELIWRQEDPQVSWNTTWIALFTSNTTLEGRIGGFSERRANPEDRPDVPGHRDLVTGYDSVNSIVREKSTWDRLQSNVAVSHHARNFIHGNHDFRFGVEFEHSEALQGYHFNGDKFYYDVSGAPYFRYLWGGYDVPTTNNRGSLFGQDEWRINDNLSVTAGVRWENNNGSTDLGTVYSNHTIAPRIGAAWSLDRDSRTVIKTHYGHYFEALLMWNYFRVNTAGSPVIGENFIDGEWVESFRGASAPANQDPNLKQPYVEQFNIGIDHIFPGEIPVGAHYIHRNWKNLVAKQFFTDFIPFTFINPIDGRPITTYFPEDENAKSFTTNLPYLYRKYDAIELYASKHFSNGFFFTGSFVYSDLRGNAQSSFGPAYAFERFYPQMPRGNLIVSRPVSWKISGTYPIPWGFHAGWFFRHESGNSWEAQVRVPGHPGLTVPGEELGSRQLPSQNLFDLRFEKAFPVYRNQQIRLTLDVFNLFNVAYGLNVNNNWGEPNFGEPTNFNSPREMRLGVRYTF